MPRRYLSRFAAITLVLAVFAITMAAALHSTPDPLRSVSSSASQAKPAAFFSLLPRRLLP